jgi:deaminated glutathione amidase
MTVAESRVAALQMSSGSDVAGNLASAGALLEQAGAQGAALAVLPENFAFMGARETDKLAVAESGRGPIQDFLAATSARLGLWIIAGTIPLKTAEAGRVAAACLVYDAAGLCVARYDKMHLFDVDLPGAGRERYRESASIAPGEPAARVVDTPVGKVGLSVCYDLRFPELFRELVRQGAEILSVPSAFTEHTGAAHWDVLLRARAIENQCYVVAPGQTGEHPGGRRTYGHSAVVDPWGRVLAQQASGEGAISAPVPRAALLELRRSFPALQHRRL